MTAEKHDNVELKGFKHLAISSPATFAHEISGGRWVYVPHLNYLDEKLLSAACGIIKRVMINMPPRHGKSELTSKYFPVWYLGNFPDNRIILISYGAEFASSWGMKVRDLIDEFGEDYFGIRLDPSSRAVNNFRIEGCEGGMSCAGAGGSITGKGADLLIIDDPVKNDAEANSPVYREKLWEWYRATAFTRLEPGGIIVLIMTRWHEDDLCGRILKMNEDDNENKWEVVKMPAISGPGDILGRGPNQPLWSDRYSWKYLQEVKKELGSYWFSSLYQQNPSPAGGGIFKRKFFQYFSHDGSIFYLKGKSGEQKIWDQSCRIMATVDLAAATGERSDYTVIVVFALTPDKDILILNVIRERFEGAAHMNLLKNIQNRYNPDIIGVESVQYQVSLIQSAMREGLRVRKLLAKKDKVSRSLAMQARMESYMVYFRKDAPWLQDFEDELLAFPNGKHDDQVDAFAYIADLVQPVSDVSPVGAKIFGGGGIAKDF